MKFTMPGDLIIVNVSNLRTEYIDAVIQDWNGQLGNYTLNMSLSSLTPRVDDIRISCLNSQLSEDDHMLLSVPNLVLFLGICS